MDARKIAVSTGWQIASQLTMAALSTIAVKCVALGLTTELAGLYNSVYGYLQLFAILADFGLYAIAVRELSTSKDHRSTLTALLLLRIALVILSLGSAVLIAWVLPVWRGTPLPIGIAIASLVPALTLLAGVLRSIFQVHYAMHFVFIAEVAQRIVTVVLMLWLLSFFGASSSSLTAYHYYLWVGAVSAAVLLLCSLLGAWKYELPKRSVPWATLTRLLRHATPYGIAFLCIALYRQFDLTLIAILRDDFQIQNAYYGFVMRITEMAYIFPTFLLNSALPALCDTGKNEDARSTTAGKTLFSCILLGMTAAIFSLCWARPIIALLTTSEYLSTIGSLRSDTILQVASFSMFGNSLVLFSFYVLLTMHQWRILLSRMSIGVFVSIALNLVLIPKFGAIGAAASGVFVHILLAVLLLIPSLRILHVQWKKDWTKKLVLFGIVVGLSLAFSAHLLTSVSSTMFAILLAILFLIGIGKTMKLHDIILKDS